MPPITEAQLFEAFGLDPKGAKGANEQELAEPVTEDGADAGAQDQEFADPEESIDAQDTGTEDPAEPAAEADDPEEPEDSGADQTGTDKKQLTPEERHANAARRRQAEQQAAVEAALNEERQKTAAQLEEIFAKAGLKNTVTGEPIKTMEEFRNWHSQFQTAQMQQQLKDGKLTPEMINQVVESNPVVQQAKQVIEQAQQAQQNQQAEADRARIDAEMAEIRKLNPAIKTFADILQMDTSPKFREYIGLGYRAIDAYKLANMDSISQDLGRQAAQAELGKLRGKNHLKATGNSRGGGDVSVPPSQMRMFRALNPGKSDAEIIKYYNKHIKNQGG